MRDTKIKIKVESVKIRVNGICEITKSIYFCISKILSIDSVKNN